MGREGDELCQDIGALRWGEKKPLRFDIECLTSGAFRGRQAASGEEIQKAGWLAGWLMGVIAMIFIIKDQD